VVRTRLGERRGGRVAAGNVRGVVFDPAAPIAAALADVGRVSAAVSAIERTQTRSPTTTSTGRSLVTLNSSGSRGRPRPQGSADRRRVRRPVRRDAKERPYPGSTTVSTVNGGIVGLTRTLVEELRPKRSNSIHPGIVGDSPYWVDKPAATDKARSETPTGTLAAMSDIVGATVFLLENPAVNGVELIVDAGWHCR
jgi:hypothetical protein